MRFKNLFTNKCNFKEEIIAYVVQYVRGFKFIKNNKQSVMVIYKDRCEWEAYCV